MDKATAALVGAVVGAVISTVLPPIIGYLSNRRRIKRELHVSVLKCRDRLLKIKYVLSDREMFKDEKKYLGTNLDDYLSSIAELPSFQEYEHHLAIYETMRPIILARTPQEASSHLGAALDALGSALGKPSTRGDSLQRSL